MFDIDSLIVWLRELSPFGVYAVLFATTYIENVFPPSPSDVIMLFIATLIGIGTIDFVPALLIATAGSVTGFLTAFLIGRRFGRTLAQTEKFPFLTKKSTAAVDKWFDKYGYGVIVVNRFLAGTRAVVSFVAGMSELDLLKTTLFCTISAALWNALVLMLGKMLGDNYEKGIEILDNYGKVVLVVMGVLAAGALVWWIVKRKRNARKAASENVAVEESGETDSR